MTRQKSEDCVTPARSVFRQGLDYSRQILLWGWSEKLVLDDAILLYPVVSWTGVQ